MLETKQDPITNYLLNEWNTYCVPAQGSAPGNTHRVSAYMERRVWFKMFFHTHVFN